MNKSVSVEQLLLDFIQKSQNSNKDMNKEENEIAKVYNELLDFPSALIQIDISTHHRILSKAIENNKDNFNYYKFLKFMIESIDKYKQYENQSLLIYFNEIDFNSFTYEFEMLIHHPQFESNFLFYRNDRSINLLNEKNDQQLKYLELKQLVKELIEIETANQAQINELQKENNELKQQIIAQNQQVIGLIQNQASKLNEMQLRKPDTYFVYNPNNQFDGILNYLKGKGAIQLTSGHKEYSDHCKISNLIDYSNPKKTYYFSEADAKTNWIEFNFLYRKIALTSYEIQSYDAGPDHFHPKTWRICGSNDQKVWDIIDQQEICQELNGNRKIVHFDCKTPSHMHYQYIRFYLLDNWHADKQYQYCIEIARFELYGEC